MPRATKRLTAKTVEHAPPGKHADGGGLSLAVKPSGRRSWVVRLTIDGKQKDIGIGGYPAVSLADARLRLAEMRADMADGGDPADRPEPIPTFRAAAEACHRLLEPTWRNGQHSREWLDSLHRHAVPLLDKPCHRITRADVLDVLEPIWLTKPETARRVRQRIRKVMSYAMARHEAIVSNPAGEGIDGALIPQRRVGQHQRALNYAEVPAALQAVRDSRAVLASKLCIEFVVLTWTRSGEARGARWDEIDWESATWIIPGDRMKGGKPHRVPLSAQALDVLDTARKIDDGSGLIFPSPLYLGETLHSEGLLKVLATAGLDTTVHGLRSAGRTWAEEATATPWAVMEAALSHSKGGVERAYARSDLFEARRTLMQAWADFVTG